MNYLLKVALTTFLVCLSNNNESLKAQESTAKNLWMDLETALNSGNAQAIRNLLPKNKGEELLVKYKSFTKDYPNVKWQIKERKTESTSNHIIEIKVRGEGGDKNKNKFLSSRQIIQVETNKEKIVNHKILSEESVVQNTNYPLSIDLNIPDVVLTGTNYDFDIVLTKPLGSVILAGGVANFNSEPIDIEPLGSGGLFKTIKAPINPGSQSFKAVLSHPKGVIAIRKKIKIVSNEKDLEY